MNDRQAGLGSERESESALPGPATPVTMTRRPIGAGRHHSSPSVSHNFSICRFASRSTFGH